MSFIYFFTFLLSLCFFNFGTCQQCETVQTYYEKILKNLQDERDLLSKKISELENKVNSLNPKISGMIAYFDSECPEGWSEYLFAKDKFILSSGPQYRLGTFGGQAEVSLSLEEMPSHTHKYTDPKLSDYDYAGAGSHLGGNRYREYPTPNGGTTESAGQGKPHNNMPPYIVLKCCKKN